MPTTTTKQLQKRLALFAVLYPAYVTAQTACAKGSGFDFLFGGSCDVANFKAAYDADVFLNPVRTPATCTNTLEEELAAQFGVAVGALDAAILAACDTAEKAKPSITLDQATYSEPGDDFVARYYNGGTEWNSYTETLLHPSDGETPEQILRQQAARVKAMYEFAQDEPFVWPDLPQFNLDECSVGAAQCCWPQDRQANDNNGNCAKPYDENCVDKDPGDNTDLCHVDLAYAPENNHVKANGFSTYKNVYNNNGEGAIHCHGFAWANDEHDTITRYKANNLFYVSMYDHMHQRGYVGNIPGAPMCGCVEKMPIVSRSDCTQVEVTERFKFKKDASTGFTGEIYRTDLNFNACQGANNNNNNLAAYYQRLVNENKVTADQQNVFTKYITGGCTDDVEGALYASKGYLRGLTSYDSSRWTFIVGEGTLSDSDNAIMDSLKFKTMFEAAKNPIVKRVCVHCNESHRTIYYRRLTPLPEDMDFLDLFMNNWFDTNNAFNVDFALYSSYDDALLDNEDARWNFCNFNDAGIGFPRDCGPFGVIGGQWSAYYRGGASAYDHAFYIEANPDFDYEFKNIAIGKTVSQSSTGWGGLAEQALDGKTVGIWNWNTVSHTNWNVGAFWQVWFGAEATVNKVYLWNRIDCCRDRMSEARVELLDGINGGNVVAFRDIPVLAWNSSPLFVFDFEGATGQTLRVRHTSTANRVISLAEVQVEGDIDEDAVLYNVAQGKTATQSTTCHGGAAGRAVDGNASPNWGPSMTHTCYNKPETWWKVDLEGDHKINSVHITNRYDCCWDRLTSPVIELYDFKGDLVDSTQYNGEVPRGATVQFDFPEGTIATEVRVVLEGPNRILSLAEVTVYGRGHYFPSATPSLSFSPSSAPTGAPSTAPSSAPTSPGDAALNMLLKFSDAEDDAEKNNIVELAIAILKRTAEDAGAYFMSWFGY